MLNNKNPNRGGLGVRRPGAALASLVGLALAVANPVLSIKRVLSSRNARRIGGVALIALAGSAAVGAYAVFSSVPGRIQVAPVAIVVHSAAALPAEVQAVEAGTAPLLFDRDTRTAHVAFADQHIDATLDRPTEIRAIKVYGPAPYELTVAALQGGTWTAIPGLSRLKLGRLNQGWNEFTASQPLTAQTLRFELTLTAGGKGKAAEAGGLSELEIWGTGEHALVNGTTLVGAMQAGNPSSAQAQPAQARAYAATPESGVIGKDGQTFRVTLDRPAARFKRAWLSYEAYGLAHWISPVRRINGLAVQGGNFAFAGTDWTPLAEPIHPDWLVPGGNRIEFALPPNAGGTYSVRNVRIVGELDDGANFIARATTTVAGMENDTPALIDGDLASDWSPYADPRGKTGKPELTLYFDRTTQLDTLSIRLVNALAGTLSVDLLVDGQWQTAGLPTLNGNKLSAGWNALGGFAQVPADALRISFLNGNGSPGEIREISATGSGVNGPRTPDILVGYPDAGQFYGRKAYLRGFLSVPDNDSGPAVVSIANRTLPTPDGGFGVVVSKDEVGYANQADGEAWQVQIDAVYPDGQKLSRIVKLTQQYDAARAQGVLPSVVNPGFGAVVVGGDASLDIDPDAVDKPIDIKITPLKEPELPPLDPGMTNVTPGPFRGYRFTPHGTKFKKHIKVTIPYDPALIPSGLNEQDIKTYFYDTESGRWVVLDRYRVDSGKRKVTSLTNHFTDMINATLTVPDHPETTSYNATQMKDIKAADPGAGINLIEPPQANNMGDARLSYPIEIPPGRLGMQPQLGIQYNSSGGNGWLGLGWDLSVPAISIDTRWGVPRYSETQETETYLLNGEMLTPVAHRGALQPRNTDGRKQFYTRVEGAFQRIIRHGNSPKDYWWEVTDKNGVTHIYGGEGDARHNGSTLGGDKGTFRWALRKTVDTHGNSVSYLYDKIRHSGFGDGNEGVDGFQLYIRQVSYSGRGGVDGPYTVSFTRASQLGETRRPDVQIDARGGFKQVTADTLRKIEVRYAGNLVRSYALNYSEGAFRKTLLSNVVQYGSDGTTEFNRHEFEYFDDIRSGGEYVAFSPAKSWAIPNDKLRGDFISGIPGFKDDASALSGQKGAGVNTHIAVSVGPNDGNLTCKSMTVGGKKGMSSRSSSGVLALVDIDGDGLPDKVFDSGNRGLMYYPNLGKPGQGSDAFATVARPIAGNARRFAADSARSRDSGVEAVYGCDKITVTAGVNTSSSTTTTRAYFADVNGDGLIDVVDNGRVLFNRRQDGESSPTLLAGSAGTPNPVYDGAASANASLSETEAARRLDQLTDEYPLHDTVRVWEAPYDGTVAVSGAVSLVEDPSDARKDYDAKADGVRVAIQARGSELWSARIQGTDYAEKTPTGVGSIAVRKGDRLYFRVQSVFDGAFDRVSWAPQIEYVGAASLVDANGKPVQAFAADADMLLAAHPGQTVSAPIAGRIAIEGTFVKPATSDDVSLRIFHNANVIWERSYPAGEAVTLPLSLARDVQAGDKLRFVMAADSTVDWKALAWLPRIYYVQAADSAIKVLDPQGTPQIHLKPAYEVGLYGDAFHASAPAPWIADLDGRVSVTPDVTFLPGTHGSFVLTVKRRSAAGVERLAKRTYAVVDGVIEPGTEDRTQLALPSQTVSKGDVLWIEYHSATIGAARVTGSSATIERAAAMSAAVTVAAGYYAPRTDTRFGPMYRQWGQFVYNGNRDRASQPIIEADLHVDTGPTPTTDFRRISDPDELNDKLKAEGYDPARAKFIPMLADFDRARWIGYDDATWVEAGGLSSSRFGEDDIHVDITMTAGGSGASAPVRVAESSDASFQLGGGASSGGFGASGGASYSKGSTRTLVEFMDMNGDRYPDVVLPGAVQYTSMLGGLESAAQPIARLGTPREQETEALGVNGGGSFNKSGKAGGVPKNIHEASMNAPSVGLNGSYGTSKDEEAAGWADVNGDGLPDRVHRDGDVELNLGYEFAAREKWGSNADELGFKQPSKGKGTSSSAGLGFNLGAYSVAGGLSISRSDNESRETLFDVNGDGLPDRVWAGSPVRVAFNTGAGFADVVDWVGASAITEGSSATESVSGYFTVCIPLPAPPFPWKLCINPGAGASQTMSRQNKQLLDIDGDGVADFLQSDKDDQLVVSRNRTGRTNLLKEVKRPLGASIALDFQRSGNTYEQPNSKWVMSRVTVNDGHPGDGPDTLQTRYRYEDGMYDRLERDAYGYRTVIEEQLDTAQLDTAQTDSVYRSVTRTFHNASYYTKGLLESEVTFDKAGRTYLQTANTYKLRDEDAGNGLTVSLTSPLAKSERARVFPLLARTERSFHEGGQGKKSTYTTFEYDAYGNVNRFTDAGDEGSDDDVEALINYSTACTDRHIVGKPVNISVLASGGLMRERSGDVDCATGNMTQLRQAIGKGEVAQTDLAYFPDGNLKRVTGPANLKGQRYALDYTYDPAVATHVVAVADSFGYSSSAAYDYRFGKPVSTTDLNGNVISTAYDSFGRTIAIHGPYEQGGSQATLRFAYFPDAAAPYAITEHLNLDAAGHVNAPIDTVLFTDGIKRVLQTKKRASVNGQTMMIVSGRTVFDGLGRTVEQYYPVVEPLGQAGTFNPANDEHYHTTTAFDVLDRTIKTTLPDDTVTTMAYGFGRDRDGKNQFQTVITDANGNSKESYRDVSELITAVKETNKNEALWTSYAYDPLKQIVQVKDVKGVLTKVEYDALGRRTVIDNPDTGRTQTVYDPASNPVQKITANLAAAKKAITYDYDFNRLAAIHYPLNAANDVTYQYGAASLKGNGSNQVGRLVKVNDASGSQENHYGKLGETVREIRTIASHTQGQSKNSPEVYTTQYRYDSFGRLLELVLPDSEVVTYAYDAGGSLQSFAGDKQGTQVSYLNLVHYDKFEQRTRLVLGNGIETNYSYDPASRRLDTLKSAGTRAGTFQNLHYGYDKVGNILSLNNQVDVPPPTTFGGPNQQSFGYDDLYRLTTAKGEYKSAPDKTRNYTLALTYDTNHNILAKKQSDVVTVAGGSAITQKGTSYDWTYAYQGSQPHAPTHIGNRTFRYDLNGNQTGWDSDVNGTRRFIQWDEENRISEIDDNGERNRYVYDAAGERVIKETKQGETVYVNQYYVVRNRSVVSKHLYAGAGRVVTHLVMGTAPGNGQRGAPGNGHGSDKTPTAPETGNGNSGNVAKGNNGQAQEQGNNGLHLGQLKNGNSKENPGQGRERRSDTADAHAQDVYRNPTLTGEQPGQGTDNRSDQATAVARNVRTSPLVITEGDASVELGGDTSGGESVEGVTETSSTPMVNGQSEFIWYYHPDHLGSTGFVTDQNGELYEHVEYFPFGETWVQEHSNTQRTPYLYTGKELDEETGLYYYGARYYDPRTSVWASADPILDEYLPTKEEHHEFSPGLRQVHDDDQLPGIGGVFNSVNLGLYTYAASNPVRYLDPDGRSWKTDLAKKLLEQIMKRGAKEAPKQVAKETVKKEVKQEAQKEARQEVKETVKELSKQQQKAIRSLEKRIGEHEKKLQEFKDNPTVRSGMEKLSKEQIEKQQQKRMDHLKHEIETFKNNIEKIKRGELDS